MKLRHFAISQQGSSHVRTGKNCQDYSCSADVRNEKLNLDMAVAAIADGVGSCDFSEDGSRIAVTTAMAFLCRELSQLNEMSDDIVLSLLKESFREANSRIEAESEARELPYLLFDTTLTIAVLTEKGSCYVGHIGDDGIVALFTDGSYSMITARIEGEEANSVFPLSSTGYWTFGVAKKPVAAIAMMTDGLLDKSVGSARMNNRVYYPFFRPMFENLMESDEETAELREFWSDYLEDPAFRSGYAVTDDITLAVVQAPELLKNVTPLPFDEAKWNRETEEARARTEAALGRASAAVPVQPSSAAAAAPPQADPAPADQGTAVPFVPAAKPANPARPNQQTPAVNPSPANSGRQENSPDRNNPRNSRLQKLLRYAIPAAVIALAAVVAGLILKNESSPGKNDPVAAAAATATDLAAPPADAATTTELSAPPDTPDDPGDESGPDESPVMEQEPVIA